MKKALPVLLITSLVMLMLVVSGCMSNLAGPVAPPSKLAPPQASNYYYLVMKNLAFNVSTMTVPAGSMVTIYFDNEDAGVPHNFAVYSTTTPPVTIFQGPVITGPLSSTFTFQAPPAGTYRFQCDLHPQTMFGDFIAI